MTALVVKMPRRRKGAVQVGAVVPVHASKQTTDDIVRSVRDRSQQQKAEISARLRGLVRTMDRLHRERAEECVPIGYAMNRPMLDDWIEIGQRMLANGGAR